MEDDFIPRRPKAATRASGWVTTTICGETLELPTAMDDEGLLQVLTDGPDWDNRFNRAIIPGEIITTWRAGIARYGNMQFLIEDLLPAAGAYCCTGKRGSGKTSVAITLALHVASGAPIWGRKVRKGRVLYMAGENPPDVMRRIEETSNQAGLAPHDEMLLVTHGVRDPLLLFNEAERIAKESGLFDLTIVDTHQSHYCGDDFNDNAQMMAMAKAYQSMSETMAGAVLILTHPNRAVNNQADLVPAGGGAFLNQLDGNYTIERTENEIQLHWSEKLRAPDFAPVFFEQVKIATKRVPWGAIKSPTVVAKPLAPAEMIRKRAAEALNEIEVLQAIASCTKTRTTINIAEELQHRDRVQLTARQLGAYLAKLAKAGLISKSGKGAAIEWLLEPLGEARAKGAINGVSAPENVNIQ